MRKIESGTEEDGTKGVMNAVVVTDFEQYGMGQPGVHGSIVTVIFH